MGAFRTDTPNDIVAKFWFSISTVLSSAGLRYLRSQGRECFYQEHDNSFIKQEVETAIWSHVRQIKWLLYWM